MVGETNSIVGQPLTAEGHSIQLGSGGYYMNVIQYTKESTTNEENSLTYLNMLLRICNLIISGIKRSLNMLYNYYASFYNISYVYLCQQEKITCCITYWPKTDLGLLQHLRWKDITYCYKELYI